MLIDTHCHLNFNAFKKDSEDIAKQSLDKQVWVINAGSQISTSKRGLELAKKFDRGIYAAVGLHPCHLYDVEAADGEAAFQTRKEEFDYGAYKQMAVEEKVVAIGETGLDYHYAPSHVDLSEVEEKQKQTFMKALDLADEVNKPVIIHARDTYAEIHEILKSYVDAGRLKSRGVVHCYLGNLDQAENFLQLGFLISFTGIITFPPKKSQLIQHSGLMEVVKSLPLEKIMVETDAPYLAPEPFRGKRNLPWYVVEVAKKIAEVKGVGYDDVAEQTTKNARELFKI